MEKERGGENAQKKSETSEIRGIKCFFQEQQEVEGTKAGSRGPLSNDHKPRCRDMPYGKAGTWARGSALHRRERMTLRNRLPIYLTRQWPD